MARTKTPIEPPNQAPIFIHIPKTGGTSITNMFQRKSGQHAHIWSAGHRQASEVMRRWPEKWANSKFKFAFVRNPWDRYVSWFWYKQRQEKLEAVGNPGSALLKRHFREFLESMDPDAILATYNRSPRRMLCNEKDESLVDKIYRFEQFQYSVDSICDRLNLPRIHPQQVTHDNLNKRKPPMEKYGYQSYYDEWSKGFVHGQCWWEIERCGYVF